MQHFSTLKLKPALIENLASLNFQSMTDIQAQSLPHILEGKDLIGQAKTGSGKTAAFGLGILNRLDVKRFRVQTLVLCPTRELADQVAKEIRRLGRSIHNIKILTLCGGSPFGPQVGSLEHGAHIIVGTPGRVEEHLRKGKLKLADLTSFVLDEADRMLDMGFAPSLEAIMAKLPENRQMLMFSATFPEKIQAMAARFMNKPVTVQAHATHDNANIKQLLYKVEDKMERIEALRLLLLHHRPDSSLVFCNTKIETEEVARGLRAFGFNCLALHGDLEQRVRDETLIRFSNKSASILVATDVAARGLDIDALDAVFNYHIARELEVHVHRVGRTGRADNQGIACSLYTEKESYKVSKLEAFVERTLDKAELPSSQSLDQNIFKPAMATLQIDGGKKQKVRAGDILGALTGDQGIEGKQVGKINIFDNRAYIAIAQDVASHALHKIENGKLKGRSFRVRRIRG